MRQFVQDNLPHCAAVAAKFKAAFGDVRMVYACENGHEIGNKTPQDENKTVCMADVDLRPFNAVATPRRKP